MGIFTDEALPSTGYARSHRRAPPGVIDATNHTQPLAGRPVAPRDPQVDELARLRAENARLQAELEKAQLVIDVKKIATLLGTSSPTPLSDDGS